MEDQVDRLDRTRIVLVAVLFCVHAMYSSHRRDGACHTTPATNSNKQPQPPTHHFFLMDSHTSCSSDWTTVSSAFSTPNPLRCHHTKYVFWGCVFFSLSILLITRRQHEKGASIARFREAPKAAISFFLLIRMFSYCFPNDFPLFVLHEGRVPSSPILLHKTNLCRAPTHIHTHIHTHTHTHTHTRKR